MPRLRSEERVVTFHDVVEFVKEEAALATDPVFSPEALKEARKSEFTNNNKNVTWRNGGRKDKSSSSFSTCRSAPLLTRSSLHHALLHANYATVTTTIWMIAKVSRRRPSKKEVICSGR